MKIAIIGAGWYGCHIALSLKNRGLDVTIYEDKASIFSQASGKNQNRLHLGFHYPRSHSTREQSRDGYYKFLEQYGAFCTKIDQNIYAVDDKESLIDYETYKSIMASANLSFTENKAHFNIFKNLSGFIETEEQLIDHKKAKRYFETELKENLVLNKKIKITDIKEHEASIQIGQTHYDFMINCTWGTFKPFDNIDIFYEPCITLLYRTVNDSIALTIMDGKFLSLFPLEKNVFTLTSVKHTPLARYDNVDDAYKRVQTLDEAEILSIREKIEREILYYYPSFLEGFVYDSYYTSIKTKLNVKNDSRQSIIESKGREIYVLSGKIDAIFYAEDKVYKHLGL